MKHRRLFIVLGSIFFSIAATAKAKNQLPEVFKNAQYVCVEAYNGDTMNPAVVSDDRHAIYNVEQQLKDWHRYAVVYQRDRADLVFLVRKGRIASVTGRVGVDVGGRPRTGNSSPPDPTRSDATTAVGVDAEAGPADDVLDVYIVDPSGRTNGPVWSHSLRDGLDAPAMPLFQRLKHEVETTYPK